MDKYIKKVLRFKNIIIYGEGVVGRRTLNSLQNLGIGDRVRYFAKSEKEFEPYVVNGIEVKSIYELQDFYHNSIFLLAVSDRYMAEIKKTARRLKIKEYMDGRKLYADRYKRNDIILNIRNLRNIIYKAIESKNRKMGNTRIKATHITCCVAQNAGDTYLSWCVRRYFAFGEWNIVDVREKVTLELINRINKTDVCIIGGGGLFLPDTNKNDVSGWQWAISEEQINMITVPIIVFSVGYNYFRGQENSELFIKSVNHLVRHSAFIGLRNMGSVRTVKSFLEEDLKRKVVFQPCTTTLISKMHYVNKKNNTKIIGVNIAFDREDRRYGENKEIILTQISKSICHIENLGYKIRYIAHSDGDLEFLSYLDKEHVCYHVADLTGSLPKEIMKCYEDVELVLGMRGHAQMIPFGMGCRIISLGTHDKMKWFLEDINALDWYIDLNSGIDQITERIIQKFENINIKNCLETDQRLKEEQDKLWEISCNNRREIGLIVDSFKK